MDNAKVLFDSKSYNYKILDLLIGFFQILLTFVQLALQIPPSLR